MKINKISLYNFNSFEGLNEFDFSVGDDEKNIILVGGKNGAGKTSLEVAVRLPDFAVDSGEDRLENTVVGAEGGQIGRRSEIKGVGKRLQGVFCAGLGVVGGGHANKCSKGEGRKQEKLYHGADEEIEGVGKRGKRG